VNVEAATRVSFSRRHAVTFSVMQPYVYSYFSRLYLAWGGFRPGNSFRPGPTLLLAAPDVTFSLETRLFV
jgi:hypothetical protein